ncbi:hypothetical protein [Chryseobacterium sp. Mn2064]|uniref:hypothetical protein n=1 Tax=Chryseobacterium sp. Mn2064 TaxID=3395263 RepID=UPI003BC2670B
MKNTKFSNFIEKLERNLTDNSQESLILTNFSDQSQGGFIGVNDSRCINGSSACNGSINDSRCSNGNCDNSINGRKCTVLTPSTGLS